jgi:Na+/melibiose symporter-like transporter
VAPDAQAAGAVMGIRLIYAALPCGLWIGAMLALFSYNLSEAKFNAIKASLLSRRG